MSITIHHLRDLRERMRLYAIPTWRDSDGEFYVVTFAESRAQEAFNMGLAPFCPLQGALVGQLMARYPR